MKVLGRAGNSSFPPSCSSDSSSSRFLVANASASWAVGAAPPVGGATAKASTYAVRIDGLAVIARYICGWVYDGSSASLCPCLR